MEANLLLHLDGFELSIGPPIWQRLCFWDEDKSKGGAMDLRRVPGQEKIPLHESVRARYQHAGALIRYPSRGPLALTLYC